MPGGQSGSTEADVVGAGIGSVFNENGSDLVAFEAVICLRWVISTASNVMRAGTSDDGRSGCGSLELKANIPLKSRLTGESVRIDP